MTHKALISSIILATTTLSAAAQTNPLYYNGFEDRNPYVVTTDLGKHCQRTKVPSTYTAGINGVALDLTSDAPMRRPVVAEKHPDYSKPFSFSVWLQTKKGAHQGTPIMGNKRHFDFYPESHNEYRHTCDDPVMRADNEMAAPGWLVGTSLEGNWYFYICDGTHKAYTYYPTAQRQAVNDGKWHNVSGSVDMSRKEVTLWYDGVKVAILHVPEVDDASTQFATVIGGCDQWSEEPIWESQRELTAFNGKLDEVKLWDRVITDQEVREEVCKYGSIKEKKYTKAPKELKVMAWNIWHGARRFGQFVGVERCVEVIKESNPDIIGVVETYGSGAMIADALGYYFYLISDNLSILSRFPIESTIQLYQPFKSGGAIINLGGGEKLVFFDIWLDWREDFRKIEDIREIRKVQEIYAADAENLPVISVGDYNCPSHLDYTPQTKPNYEKRFIPEFPSRMTLDMGFKDSFADLHPERKVLDDSVYTYCWLTADDYQEKRCERIDYIYYKGSKLEAVDSYVTHHHKVFWPGDHSALVTTFKYKK